MDILAAKLSFHSVHWVSPFLSEVESALPRGGIAHLLGASLSEPFRIILMFLYSAYRIARVFQPFFSTDFTSGNRSTSRASWQLSRSFEDHSGT